MKLLNYKQGSLEWLAMRKQAIGASDAAIIQGISPYKTRHALWLEKVSDVAQVETASMTFGKENEEPARNLFETMSGITMFSDRTYASDSDPWRIASLDGIDIDHSVIVEIKCANKVDHVTASHGKVPEKYIPQVQHQLAVTDLKHGFYFSYHKGQGIIVEVKRDDVYLEKLLKQEDEFYHKNMLGMEAPELCERDYIEMRCEIWDQNAYNYIKLHGEIKELEERKENFRKELIRLSNEKNCKGNGVVLTKQIKRGLIDYKSILEGYKMVVNNYEEHLRKLGIEIPGITIDTDEYRKPTSQNWRLDVA